MTKVKLQNIRYPDEICGEKELYLHETDDSLAFDGYFNLFYLEKHHAYCDIPELLLEADVKGYDVLTVFHDRTAVQLTELRGGAASEHISVRLPYEKYRTGVLFIALRKSAGTADGDRRFSGAFFAASGAGEDGAGSGAEEAAPAPGGFREVNIGVDICTYKREEYVARNLGRMAERLLENADEEAGRHVRFYVIDNGKTLGGFAPVRELLCRVNGIRKENGTAEEGAGLIRVFPNRNAGGAGGFTRGMLEVMNDKERFGLTHILLMDDDATVDPETVVRVYGFLRTLRDERKDMTLGGAMLREDYPYVLFCAGEKWENGRITKTAVNLDLRSFENASCPYLTGTGHEYEWYSGWWCCCYSLNIINNRNLPVPLFIHHDDMEFGARNQRYGVAFLNGVGVWHKSWSYTFPGANIYYDTRNALMQIALCTEQPKKWMLKLMLKRIAAAVMKLRYEEADLAYQGFLDFLKGPRWLHAQDPEALNAMVRQRAGALRPFSEVRKQLTPDEEAEAERQIDEFLDSLDMDMILELQKNRTKGTLLKLLTLNGWLLPPDDRLLLMASNESLFKIFRRSRVLLYEPDNGRAALAERDYGKLKHIRDVLAKCLIGLGTESGRAVADWRENVGEITCRSAWEEYLGRGDRQQGDS